MYFVLLWMQGVQVEKSLKEKSTSEDDKGFPVKLCHNQESFSKNLIGRNGKPASTFAKQLFYIRFYWRSSAKCFFAFFDDFF